MKRERLEVKTSHPKFPQFLFHIYKVMHPVYQRRDNVVDDTIVNKCFTTILNYKKMKSKHDPDMSHMTRNDYKNVYEYNDDTYLLVDALEKDYIDNHLLNSKFGIKFCLEIGSGSGYVTTFFYRLLHNKYEEIMKRHQLEHVDENSQLSFVFLCSDINPNAAQMTVKTFERNKQEPKTLPFCFDVILSDFNSAFRKRMKNKFDVLIFNPPYVPSEQDEMGHNDVRAAYAGGENGREVIDRFLPLVQDILSNDGVFYFVLIEENSPFEIMKLMSLEENGCFKSEVVLKKRIQGEYLFIVKFFRGK